MPMFETKKKIAGGLLIVVLVVGATLGFAKRERDEQIKRDEETLEEIVADEEEAHKRFKAFEDRVIARREEEEAAAAETVTDVSPAELSEAYEQNEIAADNQHKGTLVKMSGRVDSIGKSPAGVPYITIETGDGLHKIRCHLTKYGATRAANFIPGMSVTIKGRVLGKLSSGVLIEDCE